MDQYIDLRRKALQWLAVREYSTSQLSSKLSRYTFCMDLVNRVISDLTNENFLSDERYAEMIFRHKSSKHSLFYIKQYLFHHGVSELVIDRLLATQLYNESKALEKIWRKKFKVKPMTTKDRLIQLHYLCRKGFLIETIQYFWDHQSDE